MPTITRTVTPVQQAAQREALHRIADAVHHLVPTPLYPEQALRVVVLAATPQAVEYAAELAHTEVETHANHTRTVIGFGAGTAPTHGASPDYTYAALLEVVHAPAAPRG